MYLIWATKMSYSPFAIFAARDFCGHRKECSGTHENRQDWSLFCTHPTSHNKARGESYSRQYFFRSGTGQFCFQWFVSRGRSCSYMTRLNSCVNTVKTLVYNVNMRPKKIAALSALLLYLVTYWFGLESTPLTTVLNVNNYSTIALNHIVGSRNVDFKLRTTELNWILIKIL